MTYFSVIDCNLRQTSDFCQEIAYARREIGVCPINGAAAFVRVSSERSQVFNSWFTRYIYTTYPQIYSWNEWVNFDLHVLLALKIFRVTFTAIDLQGTI